MPRIIVISGTPGVGKSTLAKLLAQQRHAQLLELSKFVKLQRLYRKYDKSARSYVIDQTRVRRELEKYFEAHKQEEVIFVAHSLGGFFPPTRRTLALVIRLDPLVLTRRLRRRGWSRKKIWENVESELIDLPLYEAVKALGRAKVLELDATGKGMHELQDAATIILSRVKMSKDRAVDWLEVYDPIELSRRIL